MQDEVQMLPPPSIEETLKAIRRLKPNKAPGADGIPAELIKQGGAALHHAIHEIVVHVWEQEEMPEDWRRGIIWRYHNVQQL